MKIKFEWDYFKENANKIKHKIDFQRASTIFNDPNSITIFDLKHSQVEERWITIGLDGSNIELVVIHTEKYINNDELIIRIISARKATKNERTTYRRRI